MPDPTPYAPIPYGYDEEGAQPVLDYAPFKSAVLRSPTRPRLRVPHTLTETTGPAGDGIWDHLMGTEATDLTRQHGGEALGERIILSGRVLDENARPVPRTIVELVQTNASGRYAHNYDQHDAPLDPNFTGVGRAVTDAEGRYRFITIKPAPYPWANHANAWRPAHIHFSLLGPAFATRLVTQMYFPGDPLFLLDAIVCSVPDAARERLLARLDMENAKPYWALAYQFDFVLRGRHATPMEH